MSRYNLRAHPSAVVSASLITDITGMRASPPHLTDTSLSSLSLANVSLSAASAAHLTVEPSDVHVVSTEEKFFEPRHDVSTDNPFVEKITWSVPEPNKTVRVSFDYASLYDDFKECLIQ
ncbi:uncharacterized protein LACBIDRAFT_326846 [Laccaria bicolor S238N-H82]|uniref:Predicted protein n=1 Tax=Laccaria bicolor (strain S238N-H82 / ATCC MYA-4686) TaxID=486041 RepID=B0D9V8_LACBS|nr:uncharacterized protein LACBIDRAFT_326846 [Laccaria bicolor S238N-H82]EDR08653.1 predicted protein [Laccaria bicolor S238N-H82]|eukprot:XP_001880878.1 predicted protein [Laccaria bicolor S238N-H82]